MSLYCYVKKSTGIKTLEDLHEYLNKSNRELQQPAVISSATLRSENSAKRIKNEFPIKTRDKPVMKKVKKKRNIFITALPFFFIGTGIGMLLLVIWPVVKWQLFHHQIAPETRLFKPIPDFKSPLVRSDQVLASESEREKDLTKAANWFTGAPLDTKGKYRIKKYTLSIPKLKIEDAVVTVGGNDLNTSLIQYEPSSLPGEKGNPVIFGHSVLPEFFNPKDYHSIFATLPTVKIGDEILITADNIEYRYIIYDLKTVAPTDLSVLEQRMDNYYLSVITCVPPGLKWKRLVVRAKLAPVE